MLFSIWYVEFSRCLEHVAKSRIPKIDRRQEHRPRSNKLAHLQGALRALHELWSPTCRGRQPTGPSPTWRFQ